MQNTNADRARVPRLKWVVGLIAAAPVSVLVWFLWSTSPFRAIDGGAEPVTRSDGASGRAASLTGERQSAETSSPYEPIPVPANRGGNVSSGFRGDIHPVLHGKTNLEVAAHWTEAVRGRVDPYSAIPAPVYSLFTNLKPATPRQVYTEREFSRLMPESVESVGQVWEIGLEEFEKFLRQFHPHPSMHLVALSRRAGPDGAFGVLRAVSATHLDILFRVHAEFDIAQSVWYTPACFWGCMIVNKEAGTVESFRLWLPTEQPLNVHLTVAASLPPGGTHFAFFRRMMRGDRVVTKRDIVHVDRMELASANTELAEELDWPDSIDMGLARHRLKKSFYAFESINWVPWETALTAAREQQKPILAIVSWGALDDQSC